MYEFAASYHKAVISRDHILQALAPLYRGKAYTFLVQNRDASADEVESNVEQLCLTFEQKQTLPAGIVERKEVRLLYVGKICK